MPRKRKVIAPTTTIKTSSRIKLKCLERTVLSTPSGYVHFEADQETDDPYLVLLLQWFGARVEAV